MSYRYNLNSSHKGDRRKGEYRDCLGCGIRFWVQANLLKIGKGKYHIWDCYEKNKNKIIKKNCEECGNKYEVMLFAENRTKLCIECSRIKHGWSMDYIRSYEFQKKWLKLRKQILIRDNNTCQICGSYEKLRGNHIKRYRNYPTLRFEPTNIIIICKACDMRYVVRREEQWESYFNFNLATRGFIEDKLTLCY